MMQMAGTFAEFERAMLRERTKAGLDAARLFKVHAATVPRLPNSGLRQMACKVLRQTICKVTPLAAIEAREGDSVVGSLRR